MSNGIGSLYLHGVRAAECFLWGDDLIIDIFERGMIRVLYLFFIYLEVIMFCGYLLVHTYW